jgi:RecA-family ATPase
MNDKLMFQPDAVCPPPHSEPVEAAVLGSVIVSPDALEMACRALRSEHFYDSLHGLIFQTIVDMHYHNEAIDLITLAERLHGNDEEKNSKIDFMLSELVEGTETSPNISGYVKILLEKFRLRSLRELAIRLQQAVESGDEEQVDRVQSEIAEIRGETVSKWTAAQLSPRRFFENEPAPFNFIIPGLLAKGIVGFIYGEGGAYKSLAALWLVVQRAVGNLDCSQKWLGKFDIQPGGKSIFFSAEELDADLHHRVSSIVKSAHDIRPEISLELITNAISENCMIVSREHWIQDGEIFLVDETGKATKKFHSIVETIKLFGADLIVLETLSRISGADENDNAMAARTVGVLESLRDATSASILCVHHTSKMNRGGKTDTHGQNSLRGASALMDNARFGLWFKALPKKNGIAMVEIHNAKTFRTGRADKITLKIQYPVFVLCDDSEVETDLFDLVVADIKLHPGTKQREIKKRLNRGSTPISQNIKEAINEEAIVLNENGYHYVDKEF